MQVRRPARTALAASVAALTGLAPLALGPASAATPSAAPPPYEVVASGLDNPRQMTFGRRGALYIAESGAGGDRGCVTSPEGEVVCLGASGAVTRVTAHGVQRRVLTGLPSLAAEDGSQAIGPSSVALRANRLNTTIGLGADPAVRDDLPALGQLLGHVVRSPIGGGRLSDVVDVAGYEAAANPDGDVVDSNPNSIERAKGGFAIADAGGNSILQLDFETSELSTRAVLPFLEVPEVDFPVSPVPTSLTHSPDGNALAVGQLTGFPFEKGAASVLRIRPDGSTRSVADNLTNIMDVAYRGDTLYVVELAEDGLLNGPMGRLLRVNADGSQDTVARELFAPGGLAIRDGKAYVSVCSICADEGAVLAIPLS
jgi:hypothetical protein